MSKLSTLIARSKEYDESKQDYIGHIRRVKFTPNGLAVPDALFNGRVDFGMTDWALGQACDKLGPPPHPYMRKCPGFLRADNLNHWVEQQNTDKKWFIRTYKDDCRAVLSQEYTPLKTTDMLEWVLDYTQTDYKVERPHLDPDTFHGKIISVSKDFGPGKGEYGFGAYLGNGEVGNRSIRVLPLIQRHACTNSIITVDGGCVIVHRFKSMKFVEAAVKQAILDSFRISAERMDQVWQAAIDELPDFNKAVRAFSKQHGLAEEVRDNIFRGSTDGTRMGLINGITQAAHEQNDPDLMVNMETWAGGILVDPDSLFGKVAQREEVELER